MKLLKIKDNSKIKKDTFCEIPLLVNKILDKTLEQLDKEGIFIFPELINDAEDITKEQMILQSYNNFYCSGNVMGFIGHGDEHLIIESRFSLSDNDYFFQYLLERVMDIPNIVDLITDSNQNNRIFNLLVFVFPYYLKNAMRKGIFKTYIRKNYNDGSVKGTIDIARHIKNNTPFIGNILVKVKDELNFIVNATQNYKNSEKQKIIAYNKKNIIRHAYYHEYRILQNLCILILQHQKQQIGLGTMKTYGILFDGAWLWEEYINLLVKDIFYHPMNKSKKGGQRLFSENIGLIYPDFISKNNCNRIIGDAKYKPINNIGNKDYLQMLAYMLRFDANKGFYFYPKTEYTKDLKLWLNRGSTYENNVEVRNDICVIKHGLQIPNNAENYDDFVRKIKLAEEKFIIPLI